MKKRMAVLACLAALACPVWAGGSSESAAETGPSLVIHDQFYRDVESEVMESIIADFTAGNPGISIVRETQTLDDLKLTLKMTVESGEGPDIFNLNQGESDMGAFVRDGLVMDVTAEAKSRGWEESFGAPMMKLMGYKGDYYGISVTSEIVGVFYNREIFTELGIAVPQTLTEFESVMAQTQAAGYTPVAFGNAEGWNGIHEWSSVQHVMTGRNDLDAMMSGNPGDYWMNQSNIDSAQKLRQWAENGYFTENFSGIGSDDSVSIFMQGESAMTIHGNWYQAELSANAPFDVGFFPLPAEQPSMLKAVGGPGIPFVVSSKTRYPDEALMFMDYLARPETARLWADAGMFPALPVDLSGHADPLFAEIAKGYAAVNAQGGIGYFIDWITPTFYDSCADAVTELLAGTLSPEGLASALQNDYSAAY